MKRDKLAKRVVEASYLTGEFKLRSGEVSREYFDKYQLEADPVLLRQITKQMIPMIPADTEIIAGLEMGGIPLATALSLETGMPAVFVRKEPKMYGTAKLVEGSQVKDKKVCVIEDVITTGGQVVSSVKALRNIGAIVENVLCVIYRGKNKALFEQADVTCQELFDINELLPYRHKESGGL